MRLLVWDARILPFVLCTPLQSLMDMNDPERKSYHKEGRGSQKARARYCESVQSILGLIFLVVEDLVYSN